MYNLIVNPRNNIKYKIDSQNGKLILKNYLKYCIGGSDMTTCPKDWLYTNMGQCVPNSSKINNLLNLDLKYYMSTSGINLVDKHQMCYELPFIIQYIIANISNKFANENKNKKYYGPIIPEKLVAYELSNQIVNKRKWGGPFIFDPLQHKLIHYICEGDIIPIIGKFTSKYESRHIYKGVQKLIHDLDTTKGTDLSSHMWTFLQFYPDFDNTNEQRIYMEHKLRNELHSSELDSKNIVVKTGGITLMEDLPNSFDNLFVKDLKKSGVSEKDITTFMLEYSTKFASRYYSEDVEHNLQEVQKKYKLYEKIEQYDIQDKENKTVFIYDGNQIKFREPELRHLPYDTSFMVRGIYTAMMIIDPYSLGEYAIDVTTHILDEIFRQYLIENLQNIKLDKYPTDSNDFKKILILLGLDKDGREEDFLTCKINEHEYLDGKLALNEKKKLFIIKYLKQYTGYKKIQRTNICLDSLIKIKEYLYYLKQFHQTFENGLINKDLNIENKNKELFLREFINNDNDRAKFFLNILGDPRNIKPNKRHCHKFYEQSYHITNTQEYQDINGNIFKLIHKLLPSENNTEPIATDIAMDLHIPISVVRGFERDIIFKNITVVDPTSLSNTMYPIFKNISPDKKYIDQSAEAKYKTDIMDWNKKHPEAKILYVSDKHNKQGKHPKVPINYQTSNITSPYNFIQNTYQQVPLYTKLSPYRKV